MVPAGAPLDPRPTLVDEDGVTRLAGGRCRACRYPLVFRRPACPACGADVHDATFGPSGRVWSATVVRIATPQREPPYALAYVDLEEGPRVLAHVADVTTAPEVDTRVRLVGLTGQGDVQVEVDR